MMTAKNIHFKMRHKIFLLDTGLILKNCSAPMSECFENELKQIILRLVQGLVSIEGAWGRGDRGTTKNVCLSIILHL